MNKPLRNLTTIALMLAIGSLVFEHRATAAERKPALTIAFAGYGQLIKDLKALDQLSGHTKLAAQAEAAIELQTSGKGLAGLDKSRPWGVLVSLGDDNQPIVEGYLPATDVKKLLASVPALGEAPAANAKGDYEVPMGDKTMYIKPKGKWAVFSDNEETLGSAPAEPAPAIAELTSKYLLCVRGSVQNVPEASRDNAIKTVRGMLEFALAMQPAASEEQRAMMAANVKQIFKKLEMLSKQLDTLVIGLGLDESSKSLFLDFEVRAVDGTDLAKKFEGMKDLTTNFAGFVLPGAAMTMLSAAKTEDEDVAEAKATIANYKQNLDKLLEANEQLGDKRELAKKLLGDLLNVAEKTIELKKSDGAMAVVLGDNPALVFGAHIAEGKKLAETLKRLKEELAKDEPKVNDIVTLNAEEYEGVNFHLAKIPIPDPKAAEIFGETLQVTVGLSDSRLYFGAGKDPIAVIKKAMDASKESPDKSIDPADIVISAVPIAKFAAKVLGNDNPSEEAAKKGFAKAAKLLEKTDGKDHITITVKPIENGAGLRLNVESGVTKAILDSTIPGGGSDSSEGN